MEISLIFLQKFAQKRVHIYKGKMTILAHMGSKEVKSPKYGAIFIRLKRAKKGSFWVILAHMGSIYKAKTGSFWLKIIKKPPYIKGKNERK